MLPQSQGTDVGRRSWTEIKLKNWKPGMNSKIHDQNPFGRKMIFTKNAGIYKFSLFIYSCVCLEETRN